MKKVIDTTQFKPETYLAHDIKLAARANAGVAKREPYTVLASRHTPGRKSYRVLAAR